MVVSPPIADHAPHKISAPSLLAWPPWVSGTGGRFVEGQALRLPRRAREHRAGPAVAAGGVQLEYPAAPVAGAGALDAVARAKIQGCCLQ